MDLTAEMLPIARDEDADVFDKYMGYSSTICDLNGDTIQDFIFGGPRGNTYKGEVYIYNMIDDRLEKIEVGDLIALGRQFLAIFTKYKIMIICMLSICVF